MKPFRIYEVVAGGLKKVANYGGGFDNLDRAIKFTDKLKDSSFYWTKVQFAIMEYSDKYKAKIVKIIEPI